MEKLVRQRKVESMLAMYLKDKRLAAGLSQAKVAEHLGYSCSQFVSNWERGLAEPPAQALRTLAEIYQIPLEEIYDIALKSAIEKTSTELRRKFYGQPA